MHQVENFSPKSSVSYPSAQIVRSVHEQDEQEDIEIREYNPENKLIWTKWGLSGWKRRGHRISL